MRIKRIKFLILIVFLLSVLLSGCSKDDLNIEEGTYAGTFTVKYNSGKQSGKTTLVLKNGTFSCTGNSNRIPAGGSGSYTFENGKITFNEVNSWTADFDWNLILSGEYNYTFNGKKLNISADKNGVGNYEYVLEKQ